ncbi:MAG: hypothetical protein EXR57_05980 [Dehalococcoidia bacterium]|nr:hypothetical protein [Dehalococcoidia bacterium]
MRGAGLADAEIARRLNVDRSTIYRWLGARRAAQQLRETGPALKAWPSEREWPETWAEDKLREIGLGPTSADFTWLVIQAARAAEKRWVVWFHRRYVEVYDRASHGATRNEQALTLSPFLHAVAGLPVLAAWLNEPACDDLEGLCWTFSPWTARLAKEQRFKFFKRSVPEFVRNRIAYSSAARPATYAISRAIYRRALETGFTNTPPDYGSALAAFHKRVPMFDVGNPTPYIQDSDLGRILTTIFTSEPEGAK